MSVNEKMTAIADAIRGKTGKTDALTLEQMATEITGIETGGGGDTTIEDGLIQNTLTSYYNDRITFVSAYAFYQKTALTDLSLPNLISAGRDAFNNCSLTGVVNLPKFTGASGNAFLGCKFESIDLPSATKFPNSIFRNCLNLETVIMGNPDITSATIEALAFLSSANLDTLVLKPSTVVTLGAVNAFNETPFASGGTGGTVYVPESLIPEYQQATNWSTLYAAGTCNFAAIEGSAYE